MEIGFRQGGRRCASTLQYRINATSMSSTASSKIARKLFPLPEIFLRSELYCDFANHCRGRFGGGAFFGGLWHLPPEGRNMSHVNEGQQLCKRHAERLECFHMRRSYWFRAGNNSAAASAVAGNSEGYCQAKYLSWQRNFIHP